jgi:hypothetical protein
MRNLSVSLFFTQKFNGKVSFVLDVWSSPNQVAYHGIIARWSDSRGDTFNEEVLDLDILSGSHTGDNLCSSFIKVLKDFHCTEKILGITTDNASNCDTFFVKLAKELHDLVSTVLCTTTPVSLQKYKVVTPALFIQELTPIIYNEQ